MITRKLIILAITMASFSVSHGGEPEEKMRQITVSFKDLGDDGGTAKKLEELIENIHVAQVAESRNCSRLELYIEILGGARLNAAGPDEKRDMIMNILGADNYKMIEDMLISQMKSERAVLRNDAIQTLGSALYSKNAENVLKDVVFSSDRLSQFHALVSLVLLNTPGAGDLLMQVLLSGTLKDVMAAHAIKALLVSRKSTLAELEPAIMAANKGAHSIGALLPALREREDFKAIVTGLFRSDIGRVPDENQLTLDQMARLNLECDLLKEISEHYNEYSKDERVRKKMEQYAKNNTHFVLYISALIAFERSGRDVEYFEEMLKDDGLPEEKVRGLKIAIDRIRSGRRLGSDPDPELLKWRQRIADGEYLSELTSEVEDGSQSSTEEEE